MPLIPAPYKHTQITLAGNRVMVKIPAVSAAALGANVRSKLIYVVKVYVEEVKGSGKFILAGQKQAHEKAPRLKNGITYLDGASFDISDILQAYMPASALDFDQFKTEVDQYPGSPYVYSAATEHHASIKYYYTTECVTLATSPISSAIFTALNGHLSKRKFSAWKNTFFTQYMDDYGPFLSWGPSTKKITKTAKEYLFFIENISPVGFFYKPFLTILYKNDMLYPGQVLTKSASLPKLAPTGLFEKIHVIPCGYEQLNIEAHAAYAPAVSPTDILGYKIHLNLFINVPGFGTVQYRATESKTFMLASANRYTSRYITFRNSLGGYDTLAFDGLSTESTTVTKSTVEKAIEEDGLPTMAELETVAVDGIHEITLNTGYMEGYDPDYLLELLYSDDIRLQTEDGLIPIQLVTEELTYNDETEFLKSRTFKFRFSNTEIAGNFLGVAEAVATRPTGWFGIEPFCQVNDFGIYNGFMKFNSLELRYTDGAQEVVPGAQSKLNIEGTEGYIAPTASPQCVAANTPITNTVQSRLGTYRKNTCVAPQVGDYPTITIAAGTYGGATLSQANQRALDAITALDTQEYANTGAGAAACITGPWAYAMAGIPTNRFNLRWGQRDPSKLTGIAAGPGMNSTNPADLIYGNTWYVFSTTNPGSIYYAPQLFDNLLPIAPGTDYRIDVYTSTAKTLNVYKNGILVFTNSITLGDVAGTGYKRIAITGMTYATGDRYYIDII